MTSASVHIAAAKLLAFVCFVLVGLGPLESARAQENGSKEFYHDFRGRPLPAELELFQVDKPDIAKLEPEGLRVTLPKTYKHRPSGVGCQTTMPIQGDFEVTATVEFVDVERPPAAVAGVGLALLAKGLGVQLRRGFGAKGKHTLVSRWHFPVSENEAPQWKQKMTPCAEKSVKLRLKRIGANIHYLWAPKDGDDFEEIHQFDFGNHAIERVRLFAFNNQNPCLVDVRLIDLRIRGTEQAAGPAMAAPKTERAVAPAPDVTKSETKGWLAATLLTGLGVTLLLGIGIGAILIRRKHGSPGVERK